MDMDYVKGYRDGYDGREPLNYSIHCEYAEGYNDGMTDWQAGLSADIHRAERAYA